MRLIGCIATIVTSNNMFSTLKQSSRRCLWFLALLSPAAALQPYRYLDIAQDVATDDHLDRAPTKPDDDVQELYFVQRLDHFDPLELRTYQQRYFYSDRFVISSTNEATSADRPTFTFLCVGGEGPGFTKSVLVDSVHCTGDMIELAKKLSHEYKISVHMYALEHRYYGKSYPTFENGESPVETKNLKYLSSRQALEDLAHFVQTMKATSGDPEMRWVTFGGSYPGYMAGNARLKHPHLIYAAVSNSAPLDLKVDFPGYNERVGWDLKYEKIGGSQTCFDIVKNGHRLAVSLLTTNVTQLGEMFDVCDAEKTLTKKENQDLLLGDGLIEIYAQGNDPSCDGDLCDIRHLCQYIIDTMNDKGNELEVLSHVARKQRGGDNHGLQCRNIDFEDMLEELAKPMVTGGGWRSWLWQTCTEVGFYQTCIHEECPYATNYHSVGQDLAICKAAYNISNVYDKVQAAIDYYGGLDISAGSRVLSVNGDVDPWSVLGLHTSPKYSLPVEMVAGASHHFWTHPVKDSDALEIQQIREYIYSVVMEWLGIDVSGAKLDVSVSSKRLRRHQL